MGIASVARLIALLSALAALGFSDDASDPIRIGPGVTPPKLQPHRPEPEYTPEARNAGVQGTSFSR